MRLFVRILLRHPSFLPSTGTRTWFFYRPRSFFIIKCRLGIRRRVENCRDIVVDEIKLDFAHHAYPSGVQFYFQTTPPHPPSSINFHCSLPRIGRHGRNGTVVDGFMMMMVTSTNDDIDYNPKRAATRVECLHIPSI